MIRKTAFLGIFACIAIILGYVESLVPLFAGIPGIKLGLANLAVLFLLASYGIREAALVSLVRILVIGFLFGSMASILYSLAGAAVSLCVMSLLYKKCGFTIIGTSIAGGVTHNLAQLLVAFLLLKSLAFVYYLPALLASGVAAGILVGFLTREVMNRFPQNWL